MIKYLITIGVFFLTVDITKTHHGGHHCLPNQLETNFGDDVVVCDQDNREIPIDFFEYHSEAPLVKYEDADEKYLYSIIMADPDAPCPHYWLHWIVVNIQGSELIHGFSMKHLSEMDERSTAKVITEYNKPTPPAHTGKHRYFTYLYRQTEPKQISSAAVTSRSGFNIHEFAANHELGEVVVRNVFVTENEDVRPK